MSVLQASAENFVGHLGVDIPSSERDTHPRTSQKRELNTIKNCVARAFDGDSEAIQVHGSFGHRCTSDHYVSPFSRICRRARGQLSNIRWCINCATPDAKAAEQQFGQ